MSNVDKWRRAKKLRGLKSITLLVKYKNKQVEVVARDLGEAYDKVKATYDKKFGDGKFDQLGASVTYKFWPPESEFTQGRSQSNEIS